LLPLLEAGTVLRAHGESIRDPLANQHATTVSLASMRLTKLQAVVQIAMRESIQISLMSSVWSVTRASTAVMLLHNVLNAVLDL
jgi:pilus assembly protein TadC